MARKYNPANRYNQNPIVPGSTDPRTANLGATQISGRVQTYQQPFSTATTYTDYAVRSGFMYIVFNNNATGTTTRTLVHNLHQRPLPHVYLWGEKTYDAALSILGNFDALQEVDQLCKPLPYTQYNTALTTLQNRDDCYTTTERLVIRHHQHAMVAASSIIRFYRFFLFQVAPLTRQEFVVGE